ncbi:MAG: hypothetical protein ACFFDT_30200, partial [Candidatus Hodarchaeota archaeon]
IEPIPVTNKQDIGVVTQNDPKVLAIELRNAIDNKPIIGANVTYSFDGKTGNLMDLGNGTYIADLSQEELDLGSYTFKIIAEKANHAPLAVEYSLIVREPESLLSQYWVYFLAVGILVLGSTSRYVIINRKKRRERSLIDTKKQKTVGFIQDIANFTNLLIITPSGIPFYSFAQNINQSEVELDSTLYSSFLFAIKAFAEESIISGSLENVEDHFRFGGTEMYLHTIRDLVFVYMFSAQVRNGDWKKVSHDILERCRILTILIEQTHQDEIRDFVMFSNSDTVSASQITDLVIETLSLDFMYPHQLNDFNGHKKIGIIGESDIIQVIEQISIKEGNVSILQVFEQMNMTDISPDDIIFTFNHLKQEGVLVPLSRRGQQRILPFDNETESLESEIESINTDSFSVDTLQNHKINILDHQERSTFLEELKVFKNSFLNEEQNQHS